MRREYSECLRRYPFHVSYKNSKPNSIFQLEIWNVEEHNVNLMKRTEKESCAAYVKG